MPKFPEPPPPAILGAIPPIWHALPAVTELWRIYFRAGPYAVTWRTFRAFETLAARFDLHLAPPREQHRKIFYAAASPLVPLGCAEFG